VTYHASWLGAAVFAFFVAVTLGLSFYFARRTTSAKGYFAAHGQIHWFVNGIAFAGDYLSAASFLGICGMIAFYGYDGFLYSIGYLAGWAVALFVIAEPVKRLGRFTFADVLDSRFHSRGIKGAAALSTLVVSLFYLIPQMVGAGALIKPLFGMPHWLGVTVVGGMVITIVVTAGMVSTTWVQFLKGGLLVIFSTVLTFLILQRGLRVNVPETLQDPAAVMMSGQLLPVGHVVSLPDGGTETGPLGPLAFLRTLSGSELLLWSSEKVVQEDGSSAVVYRQKRTSGADVLRPGNSPTFKGVRSEKVKDKLNFLSLMLALFAGTASLPHILIRYYTVKDQASARKSTAVGITAIGFFYVLTLFLGLGAMASGALDVTNSNMAAPLLARSFSEWLFAIISAIAFTTVLGTVSGLILAASGAVAHDLLKSVFKLELTEQAEVRAGRMTAVAVGTLAVVLGILFEKMNVTFLVGWAFSVAASANLPALVMLLFWKGTTKQGITASVLVGMLSSLAWILLSGDTYRDVYRIDPALSFIPFSQPGIVTLPLAFAVLVLVSLLTRPRGGVPAPAAAS
jgi:cation/acetate symporter